MCATPSPYSRHSPATAREPGCRHSRPSECGRSDVTNIHLGDLHVRDHCWLEQYIVQVSTCLVNGQMEQYPLQGSTGAEQYTIQGFNYKHFNIVITSSLYSSLLGINCHSSVVFKQFRIMIINCVILLNQPGL